MDMQIYTDGACVPNPGRGGWGVVFVNGGKILGEHCGGERHTTNNRMEMLAIIEGLKRLPDGKTASVYSDSQWCVNVINKRWKARKNRDLVVEAQALLKAKKSRLSWIRGHNGNRWNEKADELAGKGISLG